MITKLLKGLSAEAKAELKANYIESLVFRKALVKMLNEEIEALQADMTKDEHLHSPNWSLIQADRIAQIKTKKKIISLLQK